ncbi:MAG: peptidoglycan-binding protein LysM [Longimicrobiales bacterium]
MGIIDFIRDAGEKLGIGDDDKGTKTATKDPNANLQKATALAKQVSQLGLPVQNLRVTFDDGTATLQGTVADQATREKVVLVVGNTAGVSRVDDRLTVTKPAEQAVFHTVEKGDTLSKIAKEQYGDASKYPVIFEANKPMLTDPDKIYPGQVLRIPKA